MIFLFLGLAAVAEQNIEEKSLNLDKGRMNIAGSLSFPIEVNRHKETKFNIAVAPQFGIFLINNLELRTTFNFAAHYEFLATSNIVRTPVFWDLGTQAIYYFTTPISLLPYIGGGLAVGFMDFNVYSLNVIADFSLGTLIRLSENFALDIGVPLRIRMSMRSLVDRVQVTPAVVGIRYFF